MLNYTVFILLLLLWSCGKKEDKSNNNNNEKDENVVVKKKTDDFSGKKVALIVGNSDYENSSWNLKNPSNDANDFAKLLSSLGFEVLKYTNLNQKGMQKAIAEFGNKLNQGDIGLFYFAGHGVQIKNTNFLIPTDAEPKSENDVTVNCVEIDKVLNIMDGAGTLLNLVILDACRNNPLKKSNRAINRGLTVVHPPKGTVIMYAAGSGEVASDGNGRNGLFTSELITQIRNGENKSLVQIIKNVQIGVSQKSNKEQIPEYRDTSTSDFFFNGGSEKEEKKEDAKEEEKKENEEEDKDTDTDTKEEEKLDFSKTNGIYSSYDYHGNNITEYITVVGKTIYYTNTRIGKNVKYYGDIRSINSEDNSFRDYTVTFPDLENTTYRIKISETELTSTDFENNLQRFKKVRQVDSNNSKSSITGFWRSTKEDDYYEIELRGGTNIEMRGSNFSGTCYGEGKNNWHGRLTHKHSDLTVEVRVYISDDGTMVIYNKQQGKKYHFEKQRN